jgi:hypothetical protein
LHCNNLKRTFLNLSFEPSVEFLSWKNVNDHVNPKNEIETVQHVILLPLFNLIFYSFLKNN